MTGNELQVTLRRVDLTGGGSGPFCCVVDVRGDIDLDSSPRLKDTIQTVAAAQDEHIALNMAGVEYLDSSGLGILLGARKRLSPRSLHLFGFNEQIGRIIALTGLDKLFDVHATEAEALAHAGSESVAHTSAEPDDLAILVNETVTGAPEQGGGAVAAPLTTTAVAAPPTLQQPRFASSTDTAGREAAGRVVLVTGGGGGVGHTVSLRWLDAGAQVVVVGSAGSRGLDDLRAAWTEQAGNDHAALARLVTFGADVTTEAGAQGMVAEVERAFGRPADTLLHLVGGFARGRIDAPNAPEMWRRLLALNLDSAFYCYRAVLAGFRECGAGWIVGIGSRAVTCPPAQMAAYAASKAGLVALTQSVSAEVRDAGIHVNLLLASTIDTPANRAAMGDTRADTWVRPDDIADATLYLCSGRARSIHGATLEVYATVP